MIMSLRKYFKPNNLPTPEQTGLPVAVNTEANKSVQRVLEESTQAKKRKKYTTFTAEDRAAIGRYAAENGNASAVKKFNGIGESTVRLFSNTVHMQLG